MNSFSDSVGHLLDVVHLPDLNAIGNETISMHDPLSHVDAATSAASQSSVDGAVYTNAQAASDAARGIAPDPATGLYSTVSNPITSGIGSAIGAVTGLGNSLEQYGLSTIKGTLAVIVLIVLGILLVGIGVYTVTKD